MIKVAKNWWSAPKDPANPQSEALQTGSFSMLKQKPSKSELVDSLIKLVPEYPLSSTEAIQVDVDYPKSPYSGRPMIVDSQHRGTQASIRPIEQPVTSPSNWASAPGAPLRLNPGTGAPDSPWRLYDQEIVHKAMIMRGSSGNLEFVSAGTVPGVSTAAANQEPIGEEDCSVGLGESNYLCTESSDFSSDSSSDSSDSSSDCDSDSSSDNEIINPGNIDYAHSSSTCSSSDSSSDSEIIRPVIIDYDLSSSTCSSSSGSDIVRQGNIDSSSDCSSSSSDSDNDSDFTKQRSIDYAPSSSNCNCSSDYDNDNNTGSGALFPSSHHTHFTREFELAEAQLVNQKKRKRFN